MKLLKKTAAVVTAASLLAVGNVGIMPRDAVKNFMLSVSAADSDIVASGNCGAYGDNLTWELDSEGTLTISGEGAMDDVIPWNSNCQDIIKVIIEDGVANIGYGAFYNCRSLTSITIPDSVTSIGASAFEYCTSLTSIIIPDSVTSIGNWAFAECYNLESIAIPYGVTIIGNGLFCRCSSASITIPDSITTIGDKAFYKCESLTSIIIPDNVTSIGDEAFSACYNLASIKIPDSVTSIGRYAFGVCYNLTSITIPDSVTTIGVCAFAECERLTSITIENPDCSIDENSGTISNYYDYSTDEYLFNGTIYGHEGSTAQAYANKYNRKFELIAPLSIVKQPASVVVPNGEKASVTVNATGDGLTYKWYYKNKSMTKFVESTSMTSATYSVDKMTSSRNGRQLYCVITDKYGNSVKTDTVTLSIGNALKITAQPESVVVPNGEKASVTVNATGDGLTYKWYYKNKGASKFSYTSTFTGNKYSVTMSDSRDGRQIYCVITDKYGNSVKTDTVTLSIGNALKITAQPESVVVPNGEKASVTVNATGDGLTYKWYYKNKGASKFSYTSTFTGNKYSVTMSDSRDGRQIYCVITDKYGNSVKTDTVTLSIGNALKITAQPESVVVPNGEKASVTVNATGDGLTYKWYYKNKGASKFSYTSTFTGNKYSVTMSDSRDGRQIYCVITDKYGNSVKTDTVTLIQE